MTNFAVLSKALREAKRFIITGHIMPDGDCLGSVLGLGTALQNIGKSVLMCSPDDVPSIYNFLPNREQLIISLSEEIRENYDLLIALDCSVEERLGNLKSLLQNQGKKVVNIDHHIDNSCYGDYVFINPSASAVGEIIYELLNFMDIRITKEIAVCLYTAILTDTGSFQYSNTTPRTLRIAAELMELGAPAYSISNWVYNEKPLKNLKALEAALSTLKLSPCGRVSWMIIDFKTQKELGIHHEHTDGLVKTARNIQGVEVALLFRETEPCQIKISLRSKNWVDVSALAASFGGGGHSRASGCVVNGHLDKIVREVVDAVIKALQQEGMENERNN